MKFSISNSMPRPQGTRNFYRIRFVIALGSHYFELSFQDEVVTKDNGKSQQPRNKDDK